MWESTRLMAEYIIRGIKQSDDKVNIKMLNLAKTDKNDVIVEVFKSKAVLAGSPTINRGILTSLASMIEELKGLSFRDKKAACFGSYGWSGESVKVLNELIKNAGFELVDDGLRVLWNPDSEAVEKCIEFGRNFAGKI